jgi:hypothetical protein
LSFLAIAVVATLLPLPWTLVGLPAAVGACVVAVIALIAMRRGANAGLWLAMGVGLALSGLLALMFTFEAAFYREFSAFQECKNDAITVGATSACQKEFEDSVNARLKSWENALRPASSEPSGSST